MSLKKAKQFFLGFFDAIGDEEGELFDVAVVGLSNGRDVFGSADRGDDGDGVVLFEE